MSGTITVTPGYEFPTDATAITKARLNAIANPTAQVDAGAITARELSTSILPVDPTAQAIIYDDFLVDGSIANLIGAYNWKTVASGTNAAVTVSSTSSNTHPGVISMAKGSTTNGYAMVRAAANAESIVKGNGEISCEWLVQTPAIAGDVSDNYIIYAGLANGAANGNEPTSGAYFIYNYATSSGKWVGKTALSSSYTSVVSSTTVATSTWYLLKVVINAAGTSIEFFINGTSIGTSTTNLPTAALAPICGINNTAATAAGAAILADYVKLVFTFTTAR